MDGVIHIRNRKPTDFWHKYSKTNGFILWSIFCLKIV